VVKPADFGLLVRDLDRERESALLIDLLTLEESLNY